LPPGLPLVQADPRRVRQVLCNLLDNAVKFSPAGSTIMVNTQNTPTVLLVSVKDEGAGIAPEHLPRLFDRFYRVESRGLRTGGVGLGLAISKGLVEAMGGQVSVASQPGEGSVFSFSLLLTSGVLEHVKEKWATHSSN
jgi:signal transduction histidine kinase